MQGFVKTDFLQANQGGSTWWVWLLIVVLLAALIIWFLSLRREQEGDVEEDLTRIEGIGLKISGLLKDTGIKSYRALAGASVERLQEILDGADFRALADPATWPEQARLAAAGDWDGLQKLQDELQGGRREE